MYKTTKKTKEMKNKTKCTPTLPNKSKTMKKNSPKDYLSIVIDLEKRSKIQQKNLKKNTKPTKKVAEKKQKKQKKQIISSFVFDSQSFIEEQIEDYEDDIILSPNEESSICFSQQIRDIELFTHRISVLSSSTENQLISSPANSFFQSSRSSSFLEGNIENIHTDNYSSVLSDEIIEQSLSYEFTLFRSEYEPNSYELDLPQFEATASHLQKQCSICLQSYHLKENLCMLGCSHMFHHECISNWLRINLVCPFCRTRI